MVLTHDPDTATERANVLAQLSDAQHARDYDAARRLYRQIEALDNAARVRNAAPVPANLISTLLRTEEN